MSSGSQCAFRFLGRQGPPTLPPNPSPTPGGCHTYPASSLFPCWELFLDNRRELRAGNVWNIFASLLKEQIPSCHFSAHMTAQTMTFSLGLRWLCFTCKEWHSQILWHVPVTLTCLGDFSPRLFVQLLLAGKVLGRLLLKLGEDTRVCFSRGCHCQVAILSL